MIFELVQARGIKAWLDGRTPLGSWSFGDSDVPGEITIGDPPLRFPTGEATEGPLGTVIITSILPDKPLEDITLNEPETEPTTLTLRLADGTEKVLKVTDVAIGDENAYDEEEDEYGIKVILANGEPFFVDEISVYIRAEG